MEDQLKYNAYITLRAMMQSRGFGTDIPQMDYETFIAANLKMMQFATGYSEEFAAGHSEEFAGEGRKATAYFIDHTSTKFELVKFLNEHAANYPDIKNIILFVWKGQKGIKVNRATAGVEIFFYEEYVNIIEHEIQPKFVHYTTVPEEFAAEMAAFPIMLTTDPVAIWYGAKKGDLFKVVRSERKGETITYRRVV